MDGGRYAVARRYMVAELARRGLLKESALKDAFLTIPRHEFVATAFAAQAYLDDALPIGGGQTISKPSIVAQMLEALDPVGQRVLELGTGSGYVTALLAQVAEDLWSIEVQRSLSLQARNKVYALGFAGVSFRTGDGGLGWPEHAPFDRILLTAEATELPQTLIGQLELGGIMVLPMQGRLYRLMRTLAGHDLDDLGPARFVPFVGG